MAAPVPRLTLTCQQCGGTFARMACEMKHKPVRFCSRACLYASRRTGTERACEQCGKAFYRKASEQGRFCGRACAVLHARDGAHSYPKVNGRHAHRVVMEQALGRPLRAEEIVHHKDEDKRNFAAENLALETRASHASVHHKGRKQSAEHVRRRVESRRRTLQQRSSKP